MATPMMAQYEEIKKQYSDCILLFRLGDFYEMFGDDAVKAAKILDITLTSRSKGDSKIPLCGVPYHAIENYLAKLTKHGEKVAICDQVSDPKLPGIVQREVTRVVTPGTTFSESILDGKQNNYVASIVRKGETFGLSYADITTGGFATTEINTQNDIYTELAKVNPTECILPPEIYESDLGTILKDSFEHTYFFSFETFKDAEGTLKDHMKVKSLMGFGLDNHEAAVDAAGFLLNYLYETQKNDLKHIQKVRYFFSGEYMPMDEATLRNLELLFTLRDQQKEGSLLSVIDSTLTSMGGRLLKSWLTHPLLDKKDIQGRLDSIEEFTQNSGLLSDLRTLLKDVLDIERVMARLSLGSGSARDLVALKLSLQKIPEIKALLKQVKSPFLVHLKNSFNELEGLIALVDKAIEDEPPLIVRDGGMIKDGYNNELDELKTISREGKNFIKDLQEKEIKRTGISSMKVKYNKVFGYYIEISKANLQHVPEDYIRKQTLVNAERYITPELKEYEEKILNAEEKINDIEYELFMQVREEILKHISEIQKNAQVFATLDVLSGLAYMAMLNNYVKPEIHEEGSIEIKAGRHPVVEKMSFSSDFIPNDTDLDQKENRLLLITGPNMGGKSTILRQTALIVLMAHIGSFVPADKAKISLVDRIFTRVGASDNLVKGQSTFMVEMQEAANILNNATSKSLIILDEIGRGTSTYDGVSIAWAITEYIHNNIQAKTLFATHYHELISVVESLQHAQNYCVSVKEKDGRVMFLYKLEKGGINRSYGIEVARLAGLPKEVVEQSKHILKDLEEDVVDQNVQKTARDHKKRTNEDQMDLFGNAALIEEFERKTKGLNKMKEELEAIDVNSLTPLEALQKLDELKKKSN
ncbi:DNA mismatch repair protein MutS [Patescibacteria group bacterium]